MSQPIEAAGLMKRYGKKTAISNINLTVSGPKIIGLIGRNGAGKTTFLKTCAGLLRPTAGTVRVWGEAPFDNLRILSRLIFIGEETQYEGGLRLRDILELGSIYYPEWDNRYARELLNRFELIADSKYQSLSLGMKTQFKVVMGLSCQAPLVLFDEPTLGMDPAVRKEFYRMLISDFSEKQRTFILSSHLPDEVENLIEEVVILKEGNIVLQQPIEVMQEYAVCCHGRKEDVESFVQNKQILNFETFGNNASASIVNDLTSRELSRMAAANIQIQKVPFQDLCIYLTQNNAVGAMNQAPA